MNKEEVENGGVAEVTQGRGKQRVNLDYRTWREEVGHRTENNGSEGRSGRLKDVRVIGADTTEWDKIVRATDKRQRGGKNKRREERRERFSSNSSAIHK